MQVSPALRPFTLPQICDCGAQGKITFQPRQPPRLGERDPDPAIVAAEGPFHIDDGKDLVCLNCGDRSRRRAE